MKNNKLIEAWNTVEPDKAADERMRTEILNRNRSLQKENGGDTAGTGLKIIKRIIVPVAACLTLVIAASAVLGITGVFAKKYTVKLKTGDTVMYKKGASSAASIDIGYDYDVTSRELTTNELQKLSAQLTSGFGTFRTDTGELVHFEGRAGETKVIMAAPGVATTDTIIDEHPVNNRVKGVTVRSGYFLANNGGKPVVLFSGEFQLGNITVYTERGSKVREASAACAELSKSILEFIEDGEPDFSSVTA